MTDLAPTMARLTITYNGQQGDLPDEIPFDREVMSDEEIRRTAAECIETGYVPGIDTFVGADFSDFVVDRFPAREDIPINRIALRPKTPFGQSNQEV